ncbi:hypothetical protein CDAR_84101 [Caerostris darwini]|uniref:Uncharacterized protein n=1 Tax=Caerostris darwini TaxID=1538125 RepID=A0AAV4U696_9ARAC|nr:hypothetical protein CDAR_84101 [Caerostris darwini]
MEKPSYPKAIRKTAGEPNISSHLNNFPDTESLRKVIRRRPLTPSWTLALFFPRHPAEKSGIKNSVFPKMIPRTYHRTKKHFPHTKKALTKKFH